MLNAGITIHELIPTGLITQCIHLSIHLRDCVRGVATLLHEIPVRPAAIHQHSLSPSCHDLHGINDWHAIRATENRYVLRTQQPRHIGNDAGEIHCCLGNLQIPKDDGSTELIHSPRSISAGPRCLNAMLVVSQVDCILEWHVRP